MMILASNISVFLTCFAESFQLNENLKKKKDSKAIWSVILYGTYLCIKNSENQCYLMPLWHIIKNQSDTV